MSARSGIRITALFPPAFRDCSDFHFGRFLLLLRQKVSIVHEFYSMPSIDKSVVKSVYLPLIKQYRRRTTRRATPLWCGVNFEGSKIRMVSVLSFSCASN